MGIEKSFRNSPEILKPSDVSKKYHKKYQTIIITFQHKVVSGLLENNLVVKVPDRMFGSAHGKNHIYELTSDSDVLFFVCPVGAPIAVGLLEEIHYAMGVRNIILYGTCGVLDKAVTAGKIIVPMNAFRDEGTSYHYVEASDSIKLDNADTVARILDQGHIDYVKGNTWTTDAFYRETTELFKERKAQGCIAVEMEISAVQAFASFRGLDLYAFIYGADNLDSSNWEPRILGKHNYEERLRYFLVARELSNQIKKLNN